MLVHLSLGVPYAPRPSLARRGCELSAAQRIRVTDSIALVVRTTALGSTRIPSPRTRNEASARPSPCWDPPSGTCVCEFTSAGVRSRPGPVQVRDVLEFQGGAADTALKRASSEPTLFDARPRYRKPPA
jgi:hypothetical protein